MLNKIQTLKPMQDNLRFGLSHDYCDNGKTLAVRAHDQSTKQDMLIIYKKQLSQFVQDETYRPTWWRENWQVAIRGINNSIYFVAIDTEQRIGHVIQYRNGVFRTMFSIDNCENTLGMNDKSIAVSADENTIAVTYFKVKHDIKNSVILYSSNITVHDVAQNTQHTVEKDSASDFNRIWSFRSLAFANNCLVAGSPDLTFGANSSDTMDREYQGTGACVDVFGLDGVHARTIVARDATPGNFFGTEIETSADGNTLIVMAPAQDHKLGCAYKYQHIDNMWLQTGKFAPRDIPIHTTIKYSLYGCCINDNGSKFLLSDGLYGALYLYHNDQLVHTHKDSNSKWFGFDIKTNPQFSEVAVIEKDVSFSRNRDGVVHVFEISDK